MRADRRRVRVGGFDTRRADRHTRVGGGRTAGRRPPAGTVVTAAQGKAIAATGTLLAYSPMTEPLCCASTAPASPDRHSGCADHHPALTSLIATADGSLIGAGPDVVVRIGADNKVSPTTQTGVTDRQWWHGPPTAGFSSGRCPGRSSSSERICPANARSVVSSASTA